MAPLPVRALLFPLGEAPRPLSWAEVRAWEPAHGALWVHLDLGDAESVAWIEGPAGLDSLSRGALLAQESRARAILDEQALLLNLRARNHEAEEDDEDLVGVRMLCDGQRLLSTRRRSIPELTSLADRLVEEGRPRSLDDVLTLLVEAVQVGVEELSESLQDRLDELEEEEFVRAELEDETPIGDARRTALRLRRHLLPMRDALGALLGSRFDWVGEEASDRLRHAYDRYQRLAEDTEAALGRAGILQDETFGRSQRALNQRLYVMTMVTALMLPLSLVTGLLGINVGGIPGGEDPSAFWKVCGLLGVLAGLQFLYLRKLRWL